MFTVCCVKYSMRVNIINISIKDLHYLGQCTKMGGSNDSGSYRRRSTV